MNKKLLIGAILSVLLVYQFICSNFSNELHFDQSRLSPPEHVFDKAEKVQFFNTLAPSDYHKVYLYTKPSYYVYLELEASGRFNIYYIKGNQSYLYNTGFYEENDASFIL